MVESARMRGFTLLELLVAMAIVAVIGVMALTGLSEVISQQSLARERTERWDEVQFAMRLIAQDLSQIHPRPAREDVGQTYEPAVKADANAPYALELSRAGWVNPGNRLHRGTVLRVAYEWEDDKLVRLYWPVTDRTLSTPPIRTELLGGVEDVQIRFLDRGGQWHLDWPPLTTAGAERLVARPRAIEFALDLQGFGRVWRLVETGT